MCNRHDLVASFGFVPHEPSDDQDGAGGDAAAGSLVAAAQLYYHDQLSQQEIAERLGVSRSTVSRLLRLARDQGIVHIEIRPPSSSSRLARELEQALDLRRAVVVPTGARARGVHVLVGPALAEIERLGLGDGDVLAVSWGRTVWEIAQARRFPPLRDVALVPAVAGFDELDVRFQTNEIARRIAHASGASVRFLHTPALPSPELRRSLLADPELASRLALWDRLTAALVGIGMPPRELEAAPAHIVAQRAHLRAAVGDVVSRHFDFEGAPVEFANEDRLIGVSRAQLRATGTVVAVAAGTLKARSIVGAARAGLVDVLVTDAATAEATIQQLRNPS
jgi:DNA-binding transcriptional regulator LsrR (DeoR family)